MNTSAETFISGDGNNDTLFGGAGNDTLSGGYAGREGNVNNDILKGRGGDDLLMADEGRDILFGGEGNDIFEVTFFSNPRTERPATAIIRDFNPSEDTLAINTGYSEIRWEIQDFEIREHRGSTFIILDDDNAIVLKDFVGDFDISFDMWWL